MSEQTCRGVTRAGRPCQITSRSTMKDERGRIVARPLQRGGLYCRFHAQPFCTHPLGTIPANFVILYIDLETTGIDATNDRIVELAATQGGTLPGASFATVAWVSRVPQVPWYRGT